ncbi:MAG: helix-turn-helix domain-containing protein [Treponema sp.]|nr:helix-turn-helix domain-containing protein [Treponema sp.]
MENKKDVNIRDKHEKYIRSLFAKNLKRMRSDRHLSQMELSKIVDISPNFINDIENEKKWPSITTISKLVKALGIEPYRLFAPEPMIKIDNQAIFKTELSDLIAAMVSERVARYSADGSSDDSAELSGAEPDPGKSAV